MKKEILVLTGSPRKGGNSDILAEAFINGAIKAGHSVSKFETAFHKIKGCMACDKCWSNGNACCFDDGFRVLEPLLEKADTLVLVSPMYWYGLTTHIKAAIDKLYAYESIHCPNKLSIKDSMLILTGNNPDSSGFDGIIRSYHDMLAFTRWQDRGVLIGNGLFEKGKVPEQLLEEADKMGNLL